jgi:ABC-type nitrate/sulfonate/bicarbonate transport system ATPase subunit
MAVELSDATARGGSLRLAGLAMTYESRSGEPVPALEAIDLAIEAGEFVVLVGPSGCGKSTLLNILAGFVRPTAGAAYVADQPIRGPDMVRGMVFQDYALFPWLSVVGNVEFGLERKRVPRQQRREIALSYLKTVGLADFAHKRTNELSGGMKQRVAIARAFAPEPSIILMDEPFGALDALTRRFLQHELLRIWQEHRKTIVFITHSVVEAIYLADRVLVMTARPGRIKRAFRIDLPHPRDVTSDPFRTFERQIFAELDEELVKSLALEETVAR